MPPVHDRLQGGHVLPFYHGGCVRACDVGAFGGVPGEESACCDRGASCKYIGGFPRPTSYGSGGAFS